MWKIKQKRCFCCKNVSYISSYLQLMCLWNFQSRNNDNNRISNISSEKRSRSFYSISRRSVLNIPFFFLEAINFLQAIKITSDKAFRLFSEHQKSSILLDSPLSKEKRKGIGWMIKFSDINLCSWLTHW